MVAFFWFFTHMYDKMHGSRTKIPSKKSHQAVLYGGILFPRLRVKNPEIRHTGFDLFVDPAFNNICKLWSKKGKAFSLQA
jgi:hypothetical protein